MITQFIDRLRYFDYSELIKNIYFLIKSALLYLGLFIFNYVKLNYNYFTLFLCTALLITLLFNVFQPIVMILILILLGIISTTGVRFLDKRYYRQTENVKEQAYYDAARQLALNQSPQIETNPLSEILSSNEDVPIVTFRKYAKQFFKDELDLDVGDPVIDEDSPDITKYIFTILNKVKTSIVITDEVKNKVLKMLNNKGEVTLFIVGNKLVLHHIHAAKQKTGEFST